MMRTRLASTRAAGSAADAIGGLARRQRHRAGPAAATTLGGATAGRGRAAGSVDRAAHERRPAGGEQHPGALLLRAVVAVGGAPEAGERPTVAARCGERGVGADDRDRSRDLVVEATDEAAGFTTEPALGAVAPRRLGCGG